MDLREGEVVLCTVDKIVKTTVFVRIEGGGEGSIVTSEVAPGRIRNLRDYVVPNKKVVCKVLRVSKVHIDLSLRRVSEKEKQEVLKRYEAEKSIEQILKSILKEEAIEVVKKIKEEFSLYDFFEKAKEKPQIFEGLVGKDNAEKIIRLLGEKRTRGVEAKKDFQLKSLRSGGIIAIKRVLDFNGKLEISYIAAGKFRIKAKAPNFKEANTVLSKALEEIEKRARQEGCEFFYKK